MELLKFHFAKQDALVSHANAALTPRARLKAAQLVIDRGVEEYATAWAFSYNTREYVEAQEVRHALVGNCALVIPKSGEEPWFAWSGAETASQVTQGRPAL